MIFKKKIEVMKTRDRATLGFPALSNLENEINRDKLIKVLTIFDLNEFRAELFINSDGVFQTELMDLDKNIKIDTLSKKKKRSKITFCLSDLLLKNIIDLIVKNNLTLELMSKDNEKEFVFDSVLNDNDSSTIHFSTIKYDYEKTLAKIKEIID